jgi:hypothetical protein
MARKRGFSLTSVFFLQLCLGVFFLMLGIIGLGHYDSKLSELARFFGRDDTLSVVMSVVEIVMGSILAIGLFVPVPRNVAKIFSLVLFALWALYILLNFFLEKSFLEPTKAVWLYNVSWRAIILVSLWVVGREHAD